MVGVGPLDGDLPGPCQQVDKHLDVFGVKTSANRLLRNSFCKVFMICDRTFLGGGQPGVEECSETNGILGLKVIWK